MINISNQFHSKVQNQFQQIRSTGGVLLIGRWHACIKSIQQSHKNYVSVFQHNLYKSCCVWKEYLLITNWFYYDNSTETYTVLLDRKAQYDTQINKTPNYLGHLVMIEHDGILRFRYLSVSSPLDGAPSDDDPSESVLKSNLCITLGVVNLVVCVCLLVVVEYGC